MILDGAAQPGRQHPLGFRPRFWLFVDGVEVKAVRQGRGAVTTPAGYHCAISRVEVTLGLDQVNTLSFVVTGEDSARFVKERFEKRMPVRIEVGYDDHPETRQALFDGHLLQATPAGVNPVEVDVEADSLMYQAREDRSTAATTDASRAAFIKTRLSEQPTSIKCNLEGVLEVEQDEGGAQGEGSLLDFIQRWSRDNFVHWLDRMNGEVAFFYPGEKPTLYRPFRTWHLSGRRVRPDDTDPPILNTWSPKQSFVEAPFTITATYYLEDANNIEPKVVTAENERGVPESSLHLGNFYVKNEAAAQAIVDAAAEFYYWHVIEGEFGISAGLPILPLDEVVAKNPPPGLEDYYDRPFEVVQVRHVLDHRGWTVRGKVRAGRGA